MQTGAVLAPLPSLTWHPIVLRCQCQGSHSLPFLFWLMTASALCPLQCQFRELLLVNKKHYLTKTPLLAVLLNVEAQLLLVDRCAEKKQLQPS